jgi:tetratricopeptide (TPR) repeat protein
MNPLARNPMSAKVITFALLLVLYATFLVYTIHLPAADDLPRQIKIGEELLRGNWDILYKNTFSYTEPEHTFYNHHWLSGVVFYLLHALIGWSGLVVFKVAIFLLAFSIIFFSALKKADFWLVACAAVPAILVLQERTGLRPEVFSYLFIAIYVSVLLRFEEKPRGNLIFILIPLQLLWVNMHVFFSIGIMMLGAFVLEKIVVHFREWRTNPLILKGIAVLAGISIVSLLNPRGIFGVFYRYPEITLKIAENQSIAEFQRTWAPLSDISVFIFKPLVGVVVASILLYILFEYLRRRRKISFESALSVPPVFYLSAIVATAAMSFFILRGLSFFGFMFLLTVPAFLQGPYAYLREHSAAYQPLSTIVGRLLAGLCIALLIVLVYLGAEGRFSNGSQQGIGLASTAEGSAKFFLENNLKGPIFNDADIGSYLIYYLYPREKVFSDNRFGDAYSPAYWDKLYLPILSDENAWRKALPKYQFNVIFVYQYDGGEGFRQFLYNRFRDPEWVFVYADAFAVIFVRNVPENQSVIERHRITYENAREKLAFLIDSPVEDDRIAAADLLNLLGETDAAREVFLDVVIDNPQNGKIWMIMGEWELSVERPQGALVAAMFLEKALASGNKTAETYSFLGAAYYRLGRVEKAKEMLEKALEINPERADAQKLLGIILASPFDLGNTP